MNKLALSRAFVRCAAIAATVAMAPGRAHAQTTPDVDPAADRVLRAMGAFLQGAQSLSFRADSTYDHVQSDGQKTERRMTEHVAVSRPGRLHVVMTGDEGGGRVHNDGAMFVMFDPDENTFARTEVPDDLGAAIDQVYEEFAIEVPVADLVSNDPHAVMTENVETGRYVGKSVIDGAVCHHLAFTQETIDWQIWIEDGPRPLPRRAVITYKQREGVPQYAAAISDWRLDPKLSDHVFRFEPPVGAREIDFIPVYDVFETEGDEQ